VVRKKWKLIAGGVALVLIVVVGLVVWRFKTFFDDTFSSNAYHSSFVSPTPDVQQTTALVTTTRNPDIITSTPGGTLTTVPTVLATALAPTPTAVSFDPNMPLLQRIRNGQRITALFMGYSGPGHDGPYLTDTLMVLSFDPKTKTITEINVPRDLYVPVAIGPGGANSWGKVNGVFSTIMEWKEPTQEKIDDKYHWTDDKSKLNSAAALTVDTIEHVLGIPIDVWVGMDFSGFRKLIDALGGINVCVDRTFTDTHYPRNDNDQIDASEMTVHFEAGCQQMDGNTAIEYARSRKSEDPMEGGDFARGRRQQKVVEAVKQKAQNSNLFFKFLDVLGALDNNIHTSLTFDEARSLLGYIQSDEGKQLQQELKFDSEVLPTSLVADGSDPTLGYILNPAAGKGNFKKFQDWLQADFAHILVRREQVWVLVINSSTNKGAEDRLGDYLLSQGFHVSEPLIQGSLDSSILYDYSNGAAATNIALLKKMMPNLKVEALNPAKNVDYPGSSLVLYLGNNYNGIIDIADSQ
jgi:LCP family protein required for cell wall assembly